jgi:16S rRNA (guanine527-N7)-methyltransferase
LLYSEQEQEKKLEEFVILLMSFVGKIRLTGAQTEEALREHIQDAIYILPYLPKTQNPGAIKVLDVGTGGGLPGIVWAICRPDIEFTLLDSIRKKCVAVEKMCDALSLENTSVVCARVENYEPCVKENYDVTTARAVAAAPRLIEWLAPHPHTGGVRIAPKGPKYSEEIALITDKTLAGLKLSKPEIIRYGLETKENYILIWRKL